MRAKAAMIREKRRGSVSMRSQATDGFVTRRRPPRRLTIPRAADAQVIRRRTNARRAAGYVDAVRLSRAQIIDLAIALPIALLGVLEAIGRDNTDRWLTAALVNGAAVALRRRYPLPALAAVVIAQALAHDATYDTDPLSPFLAELILLFTVAYELRFRPALAGLGIGLAYVAIDFASGRIERISQAAAQIGFYLLAWGAGRVVHGHETRAVVAQQEQRARSPTSARGSPASCTTRSRTACR